MVWGLEFGRLRPQTTGRPLLRQIKVDSAAAPTLGMVFNRIHLPHPTPHPTPCITSLSLTLQENDALVLRGRNAQT